MPAADRRVREPKKIRWVDYARRSMQRLGHLKLLVGLADSLGSTTLQGITSRFEAVVTAAHQVPENAVPRVLAYRAEQRLHKRYGGISEKRPLRLEIQDLYLSDPALPSSSGAVTGDGEQKGYRHAVYVEMPPWAASLGLLRRQNYSTTDRAKAVLSLAPETMRDFRTFNLEANPFLLGPAERLYFLYMLVDSDGDLLVHTYRRILSTTRSFTRSDVGKQIAEAMVELRSERLKRPASGPEVEMSQKMREVVSAIHGQSGTGMGPRESVATPRTEPLVDCDILSRTSKNTYAYEFTDGGRRFLEQLTSSQSVADFIQHGFASAAGELLGVPKREMSSEDILSSVARGYAAMRRGLGYVVLREATALSIALAVGEGAPAFEIDDAEAAVRGAAKRYGRKIRFTRTGVSGAVQFRLDQRLVRELT